MTGGTARMVSRRALPASQSRNSAISTRLRDKVGAAMEAAGMGEVTSMESGGDEEEDITREGTAPRGLQPAIAVIIQTVPQSDHARAHGHIAGSHRRRPPAGTLPAARHCRSCRPRRRSHRNLRYGERPPSWRWVFFFFFFCFCFLFVVC